MSDAHAADHGHDDQHEAFDPEPATELGADEPRTPGYMPVLGAALLLFGGVYYLAASGDTAASASAGSASALPAASAAAPVAPAPLPGVRTAAAAAASGAPKVPQDPAERKRLLDSLLKQREKRDPPAPKP